MLKFDDVKNYIDEIGEDFFLRELPNVEHNRVLSGTYHCSSRVLKSRVKKIREIVESNMTVQALIICHENLEDDKVFKLVAKALINGKNEGLF